MPYWYQFAVWSTSSWLHRTAQHSTVPEHRTLKSHWERVVCFLCDWECAPCLLCHLNTMHSTHISIQHFQPKHLIPTSSQCMTFSVYNDIELDFEIMQPNKCNSMPIATAFHVQTLIPSSIFYSKIAFLFVVHFCLHFRLLKNKLQTILLEKKIIFFYRDQLS